MSYDPFATEDEAQAAPEAPEPAPAPAPRKSVGEVTVDVKPNFKGFPVAEEGKVVLTLKGGAGFDDPWIVIHANDLQDANDQLSGENADLLVDTMHKLQSAAKKFVSLGGGSKSSGGNGGGCGGNGYQRRSNAPKQAQEPPAYAPPAPGPDWVYKSGTGARGPWEGWFPPYHLKDKEKPVWFSKDDN